ncbi:hypothetical protein [Photobacterium leiognathi]|uniref:Uncharacterized protein n=1 Tax=Photobacterium leiognathi TaxID=553611 RepID=A0ABX5GDY3_PHOLE|nr:hypothetical protein [Photobacterium leiognathi]KJF90054.1 hypothetical protein UB42_09960 [Photobacterium leiognathi]PSV80337.1 hypothetical protein CTM94_14255 [Photobacterium leiognathi]
MNLEHDTIMSLFLTVGIFMSLPWIARICRLLGRAIALYLVPATTIKLKVEGDNYHSTTRIIKLDNTDEIADVILKATGHIEKHSVLKVNKNG